MTCLVVGISFEDKTWSICRHVSEVSLSISEEGEPSDQCKETSSSWLHHQGLLDIGVDGRGVEHGEDCEVKKREVERWAIESMVAEPNLQEESKAK